ncbi:MAG: 50S ribosomal protein L22 [Candidatus Marinamargulisbacteria bacterium]
MMAKKSKKIVSEKKLVDAKVKYVRVSPYKLRKVADLVRTLPPQVAVNQLRLMPQKSATVLFKLFSSCLANASHNFSLDPAQLVVDRLIVNEGPRLKRHKARARGRIFGITKPYAHVELTLVNQGESNGSKS